MHSIFLTFVSSAILFGVGVFAQNNCQLPISNTQLEDAVHTQLPPEGGPLTVQINNTSYNCLTHADDPTFYLHAAVSIEYTHSMDTEYIRAVYECSGSNWVNKDISSSVTTLGTESFLSSAYLRENCSSCSLTAPDDYLCVACNVSCLTSSNSLEYCYGPDSTECCNFILNGTCTIGCPVNFGANTSGVCVCQNEWVGTLCDVCPIACVNGTQNANCSSCECIAGFEGYLCDADIDECDTSPCANNGTCMDLVNNFTCECANSWIGRTCDVCSLECGNGTQSSNCTTCICDPGYAGESCGTDIDECSVTPCANGGNCSDRVNNFTCSCIPFWEGRICETCSLGCVNGTPSVSCSECLCEAGFSGELCDVDINECQPMPCLNNGTCQDQVNNYSCVCGNEWIGRNCSECGLTCINGEYSSDCSTCICDPGYSGDTCDTDINECMPNPCLNNGTCQDQVNNYSCVCANEWSGRNCGECSLTCTNGVQRPDCSSCICTVGFNGSMCEENIDDCESRPCLNNGTCQDLVNNYTCACTNFWVGETCNECPLNCTFGIQESDCSMCNCSQGFSGTESCSDVDECAEQEQRCPANANCNNTFGGFECPCINAFVGSQCDQCPLPCGNGTNSSDCSTCVCDPGYSGDMCDTDINECMPNPCVNNGTCQDQVNNYSCVCTNEWSGRNCGECSLTCTNGVQKSDCSSCNCTVGFNGSMCEENIDDCESRPCLNNGTCQDQVNNYTCACTNEWSGRNCSECLLDCNNGVSSNSCSTCICDSLYTGESCDVILDPCEPKPCRHEGECVANFTAFECICLSGYIGEDCGVGVSTCSDSDACNAGACVEAAVPEEIEGVPPSYCVCPPSYIGTVCDEIISGCVPGACQNGGRCDIGRNELYNLSFTCACRDPFSGPNCQLCPLDGLCQNGIRSADCSRCICNFPYTGTHCSESSCSGNQVIDGNQCKDACSTNNYQPSARNKDVCSACGIDNCVQCDKEGGVCTECQVGYMVDKKECVRILLGCGIPECERCYAGICTVCVSNYSLTLDNGCQQIFKNGGRSTYANNLLPIILGSVAGAVLLCVILLAILIAAVVGVVYYKKSKRSPLYEETSEKDEIEFSNPIYLSSDQSKSKESLI